jgi:hypothetical protein
MPMKPTRILLDACAVAVAEVVSAAAARLLAANSRRVIPLDAIPILTGSFASHFCAARSDSFVAPFGVEGERM